MKRRNLKKLTAFLLVIILMAGFDLEIRFRPGLNNYIYDGVFGVNRVNADSVWYSAGVIRVDMYSGYSPVRDSHWSTSEGGILYANYNNTNESKLMSYYWHSDEQGFDQHITQELWSIPTSEVINCKFRFTIIHDEANGYYTSSPPAIVKITDGPNVNYLGAIGSSYLVDSVTASSVISIDANADIRYRYSYVKVEYQKNEAPMVNINSPIAHVIYGPKDTTVVPQISVSDPDNDALNCKYFIDGVEKETKSVAGNTITPQTVNFSAVNMGALSEGSHTMKVTVNDGLATAEKTVTFTIDKTPPNITNLTAASTENSMTITGSATDTVAGMDTLPYNYTVTDGTSTFTSGWKAQTTHTQGSLQPNRNCTVKLEARDKAGNTAQKTITAYTKAQTPSIAAGNSTTTTMDITVSDGNPANTQYQIAAGTKYVSQSGALSAAAQWITLTNKKIKATGMTPNTTYGLKVKAKNGANEETPLSSATVNKMTLPAAPENVTPQPGQRFITLTWSAMPNITRYEVSADGAIKDAGTQAAYTHEGLTPNTQHSYRVRAVNAGGAGDWSTTQTLSTLPDPPGVPSNLRGEEAQNEIILAWDAVEGAVSYEVEADGSLKENIQTTAYTHSGLQPDTPHTYKVRAKNRGGAGNWSDILNMDTLPVPPDIPEGLQIKETTKDTVTLAWNSTERAEGYDIEAGGAIMDSTAETSYTHTGLIPDTEYVYKIRARNRGGESGWTAEAIARTLPEKPSIPNNLTATAGTKEITISWDNAERAAEYEIEAEGEIIAAITGTSYIHEGLAPDTKHTYRVKARNTGGESEYSAAVTAYTLTETTGMALTNVAAVVTNTGITLMWDAVAADTEYDVESDGEIKDNGKSTVYIHSGLKPVTSHTYKIRPKRGEEAGPWCAVLAISTLPNPPDAPENIIAIVTNTAIQLMWEAEEGATGYEIEIDGAKVESTADTTYIHKELIPGTEHSYRIRAVNIAGAAPWSEAIVKSTIKPTYMIEAEAGKEYHIALTAMGMQEFGGKKLVLKYNPEEIEIADLCEETRELELESGRIAGTGIKLSHTEGRKSLDGSIEHHTHKVQGGWADKLGLYSGII